MKISHITLKTISTIRLHIFDDHLDFIASKHYEALKPYVTPSEFLYALFKTCKNQTAIKIASAIDNFLESLSYADFKHVMKNLKDDELVFHYFAHFLEDSCQTDPFEIVLHNPQLKPQFPFVPEYFLPISIEHDILGSEASETIDTLDTIKQQWIHLLN
jgi:hypothetical protein